MFDEIEGPGDWKKRQEAVDKRMATIAKKSGSDLAGDISKRKEAKKTNSANIEIISMLSYEAQDQLRSGKMTLKEVVKDLCEALEAMVGMKDDEKGEKGE
jgi:hypothetical protein